MRFGSKDEKFMRRALALARRGVGKTSPNPAVGAVLVRNGKIIAGDYHKRAGGPHAEVLALRQCCRSAFPGAMASGRTRKGAPTKSAAQGATLYVTMEPCSTWGKTPPCTDAIIAAGVKRVVVATLDPNRRHNGRGLRILKRAGIRVESGLLAGEATRMNEAFNKWITTGMPLVIAKAAMSADGKIASHTGDSKWITSAAARREAHKLRASVDAVMVGAGTVRRDNPSLTIRHGVRGRPAFAKATAGKPPWRVVVDARGRVPRNAGLFRDSQPGRTLVVTTNLAPVGWRRYLAALGIDVIVIREKNRRVDLRAALRALGRRNVTSVLAEGGGELLGSLFDEGLVDRVAFFYAPAIIGGREAVTAVQGEGARTVSRAVRLRDCRWRRIGEAEMLLRAAVGRERLR
jgi:diaminohydroxyphosphoribosylaminopyrimidine deaminase/5-amino-6-(5-phosphoribosylamino)uracil reductase